MEEDFRPEKLESELSGEMSDILALLEDDPEFKAEIESIIEQIHKSNYDISKVFEKIMLLLENSVRMLILKEKLKDILSDLQGSSNSIKQRVQEIAVHLMIRRNLGIYNSKEDIKDFVVTKACDNLKAMMKRFVIYEIYKLLTPRMIAGQTRLQNFIANFILRGERVARRFEGGTEKELKKYNPKLLQKLRKKRKQHVKSGIRGISATMK
jgi:hypothetical protein